VGIEKYQSSQIEANHRKGQPLIVSGEFQGHPPNLLRFYPRELAMTESLCVGSI